ncbi:MAG TPA: hypothetical protein VGF45_13140 [Polyangia bacterium]
MNATGSDPRAALAHGPVPAEQLPPAIAKLCAGPTQMKLMAAKGVAPLRPAELLTALHQLSFDADAAVKAAAEASVAGLPDAVVSTPLGEPLPPAVLHRFAGALPINRTAALERILYNPATEDRTFVLLAGRLQERELEIIFQNEARLLRSPAILEALYLNPAARMSSLNRAIELLARNNVRVEGIPAFDDIAKSILTDPAATAPEADQSFAGILSSSDDLTGLPDAPAESASATPPAAPEAASPEKKRKSATIDFSRLKLYEKIRLATLGNAYCRSNLMRDPNRLVALAAIRSPGITDGEIALAAGNRSLSEDVIRYIANQRDMTKDYQVRLSLVQNPKCPVGVSLKFLSVLNAEDLKQIARSKNVPGAIGTAARRLMQSRKPE